jgi:preprotein translocase subunit SecA
MAILPSTKTLKRILGDPQAATVKRMRKRVKEVNALADEYEKLSDAKLKAKTKE